MWSLLESLFNSSLEWLLKPFCETPENSSLVILGQWPVFVKMQYATYSPGRLNELKTHRIPRLMLH